MAKVKKISYKLDSGEFSEQYPIGVDGENVDLASGSTLEDKLSSIDKTTTTLNSSLSLKAPTNHASSATSYGVGSSSSYGHLKITDSYDGSATTTAISQKGAKALYDSLDERVTECENNSSDSTVPTSHASETDEYGVGTSDLYGHLKIVNEYQGSSEDSALSQAGANAMYEALIDQIDGSSSSDGSSSDDTKAPISHASTTTKYGVGTSDLYGHLKIVDSYSGDSADSALSQKGAKALFEALEEEISNIDTSGGGSSDDSSSSSIPTNHASTATTYGVGTSTKYGHVKIVDSYSGTSTDSALSQNGAKILYDALISKINSISTSGSSTDNLSLEIVDGNVLFCEKNIGYIDEDDEETLVLREKYFTINTTEVDGETYSVLTFSNNG
jgi:hypothetical protein